MFQCLCPTRLVHRQLLPSLSSTTSRYEIHVCLHEPCAVCNGPLTCTVTSSSHPVGQLGCAVSPDRLVREWGGLHTLPEGAVCSQFAACLIEPLNEAGLAMRLPHPSATLVILVRARSVLEASACGHKKGTGMTARSEFFGQRVRLYSFFAPVIDGSVVRRIQSRSVFAARHLWNAA
jgi:hypothetical protein